MRHREDSTPLSCGPRLQTFSAALQALRHSLQPRQDHALLLFPRAARQTATPPEASSMSGAKAAPGWQIKASEIRREEQGVQWAGAPRVCCVQWEVCGRWRGGGGDHTHPLSPSFRRGVSKGGARSGSFATRCSQRLCQACSPRDSSCFILRTS